MAAKKKKQAPANAVEAEYQKFRATHARALSALRGAIVKLAKGETDVGSVRRLVERCYKTERMAFATYDGKERDDADLAGQIEALTRTIAEASEAGQRVHEIQRRAHLAELDASVRDSQHVRYEPGLGYVRGRRVIA